jgi:hypothetical protein
VPTQLSHVEIQRLARMGAQVRLAEIRRERGALNAILNDGARGAGQLHTHSSEPVRRRSRRRVTWTAAQRKAVSARMKKYWAKRRKAKVS